MRVNLKTIADWDNNFRKILFLNHVGMNHQIFNILRSMKNIPIFCFRLSSTTRKKIQLSFVPICNHLQIDTHAIVGLLQSADITEYESERETREFIREEAVK